MHKNVVAGDLVSDGLCVLLKGHDRVGDFDVNRNDDVLNVERTFQSHCQPH